MGSTISLQLYLSFNDSSQKDDIIYNILPKKNKTQNWLVWPSWMNDKR